MKLNPTLLLSLTMASASLYSQHKADTLKKTDTLYMSPEEFQTKYSQSKDYKIELISRKNESEFESYKVFNLTDKTTKIILVPSSFSCPACGKG